MQEIVAHIIQPTDYIQLIISISTALTSLAAIFISVITYRSQVRHNKNSVRPILDVIFGDYENDLYVRVDNHGVGPAIIKSVVCRSGRREEPCLVSLIPERVTLTTPTISRTVKLFALTDFVEDMTGRTIPPQGRVVLLRLPQPHEYRRAALRCVLRDIRIQIQYTDIYGKEIFTTERDLSFFGRTLIDAAVEPHPLNQFLPRSVRASGRLDETAGKE